MPRPKKKPCIIYAFQCAKNHKVYIGCTENFDVRIKEHFRELRGGHKRRYGGPWKPEGAPPSDWQSDYDRYGKDAFKVYILERDVPPEKAYSREDYWIDYYNAKDPDYGYNIISGKKLPESIVEPGLPFRACAPLQTEYERI